MQEQHVSQDEKRSVTKSALVFGSWTLFSRILGYLRETIMVTHFSHTVTDAYVAAFRLSNFFRRMLGEGTLSVSFLPIFVELLHRGHTRDESLSSEARDLVNGVFTVLVFITLVVCTLGMIWAEPIAGIMVGGKGFMQVPGKFELAVKMTRVMFPFLFFITLYAYFMAILNSFKKFAAAAFAPTMFSIAIVISALTPEPPGTFEGFCLSIGVVIGGFLQMAILIPSLIKQGYLPRLTFKYNTAAIRAVFASMPATWIGIGVLQITNLINNRFGSELGESTVTAIYLCDRVLELPLGLFAVSVGSALLPSLSQLWAKGAKDQMQETTSHALRMAFFLAIPSAIGLFVLARPIVAVLFQYGKYDAAASDLTAAILRVYGLAVLSFTGIRILANIFYAIKNTWVPGVCALVALIGHVFLALQLIGPYGAVGLTSSAIICSFLNLTLLFLFGRRLVGHFPFGNFFKGIVKFALAGVVLAVVLQLYPLLETNPLPGKWAKIAALALTIATGGLAYFATATILKAEEAQATWRIIARRLKLKSA